jgi:hypothetical protein
LEGIVHHSNHYEVKTIEKGFDCECCGWCDTSEFSISLNGELLETFEHDGHFGAGNWDGQEDSKILLVIAKTNGYNGVDIDHPEYTHQIGSYPYQTLIINEDLEHQFKTENSVYVFTPPESMVTICDGDKYFNNNEEALLSMLNEILHGKNATIEFMREWEE